MESYKYEILNINEEIVSEGIIKADSKNEAERIAAGIVAHTNECYFINVTKN
ncbi:MAG TPA: hypothetical protein VMX17_17320 [Candidatus Glassbacteria bacterium]|nr:hypothetical protein [Candidatus Glassbacteria bacterium]